MEIMVGPRYVKAGKYRPFQKETLDSLKSNAKVIKVEAPVGAGKSHIIRNLLDDEHFQDRNIILTYPTKILMDAQVESIRKEFEGVSVWPDDADFPGENINVFKYSLDSLSYFFQTNPNNFDFFENRGELLKNGIFSLRYGKKCIFVTTPDVLWLIYSGKYKGFRTLQSQLKGSIVSFDEFHAYANLQNFYFLLKNLIFKSMVEKVVLLSATPFIREKYWAEIEEFLFENNIKTASIDFKNSEAGIEGTIFNYPLKVEIHNFRYVDISQSFPLILKILDTIETPAAIIFDSIFRLIHFQTYLNRNKSKNSNLIFREWSGRWKDKDITELVKKQEKIVVLGTSAIEVGIDMKFRSLITEAANWISAIQRIGRVGRMPYSSNLEPFNNVANVYLLIDSRDTVNELSDINKISRNEFEKILTNTLMVSSDRMVGGELFRGENFGFVLINPYFKDPIFYSEAIFSIYEINEADCISFWGDEKEKRKILHNEKISQSNAEKIIIRDKLVDIWGIVKTSRLKSRYEEVLVGKYPEEKPTQITIYTESNPSGFTFYKEKVDDELLRFEVW
jgi:CRISPR-associated helicase Cas3